MSLSEAWKELEAEKVAAEKDAARDAKRATEMDMWRAWKDSGEHPDKLAPLLVSLQPIISHHVNRYAGHVPVPTPAIEGHVTNAIIKGLKTYEEGKGTQLSSWLHTQAQDVYRFVTKNQNMARITEDRSRRIGDYKRAVSFLSETLDRAPTAHEIADHLKMSVKQVNNLAGEMRRDLVASVSSEDPFVEETPRSREILGLIEYELTPTELQVFEHLTGRNGKVRESSTSKIAKKLGWNDSKVSQVKAAIAAKINPYLHG